MKIRTGKAASIPAGLGISLSVNMMLTAIMIAILTVLLSKNTIAWENTGYWIMGTLLLSSFLGGKAAIAAIKTQRYLISLMSGLLYWMMLICITALFFGGQYSSVLETGALILAGSVTSALLHYPRKSLSQQKQKYSYR